MGLFTETETEKRDTMDEFAKELTAYHVGNKIAPGVQIAWLVDKGMFYMAVHTFPMGIVESRTIIARALDADYETCLSKLKSDWEKKK